MKPPEFNVAIWAAVSTRAQTEGASIPDQLARCRLACEARGWRVVTELVVPGHSREYTSLDAAMIEIPQLADLFALARTKKINLLVCYDLNRFRGVQVAVGKTLGAYGAQTYSITQPIDPRPPENYAYYKSDAASIITAVGGLVSDLEIAALRRRYAIGMPYRVDTLGLHFNNRTLYGYAKPPGRELDSRAVMVQVPAECAVLLQMKRQYESGVSLDDIAAGLNARGVPTPRGKKWNRPQISYMLTNPFYAGLVARGKEALRRDMLTGKRMRTRHPHSEWVLHPGKHEPLWSVADYEKLVALRDARGQRMIGHTSRTFAFSRLLYCGTCGRLMQHHNTLRTSGDDIYRCLNGGWRDGHARAHGAKVVAQLREVVTALLEAAAQPADQAAAPTESAQLQTINAAIAENDAAKIRFQRLAGRGLITDDDLVARLHEIAAEREALQHQADMMQTDSQRAERRALQHQAAHELMKNYDALWSAAPETINHHLSQIIEKIVITDHAVTAVFLRE